MCTAYFETLRTPVSVDELISKVPGPNDQKIEAVNANVRPAWEEGNKRVALRKRDVPPPIVTVAESAVNIGTPEIVPVMCSVTWRGVAGLGLTICPVQVSTGFVDTEILRVQVNLALPKTGC